MRIWGTVMTSLLAGRNRLRPRQFGERLPVYLVGIEPAQLLGEQLVGIPAMQRHGPVRLSWPRQCGVPSVQAAEDDLAVSGEEADAGHPRTHRYILLNGDAEA